MKKVLLPAFLLLALAAVAPAADIQGTYVEARNLDVWVAHCFANSEAGIAGDVAVMAWKVDKGSWNNVSLNGLGVVAVIKAKTTLGGMFGDPYPTKAILIFDERANSEQRQALQGFVQKMAGDLVQTVVRSESAPIEFALAGSVHNGTVRMKAGNLARIETRPLEDGDSVCHNAFTYYEPLVKLTHSMPVHTIEHRFAGDGLNTVWSSPDKNGSFLGSFDVQSD